MTSVTFREGRKLCGGDDAALFASKDGSFELTKFSELPEDSGDCGILSKEEIVIGTGEGVLSFGIDVLRGVTIGLLI